MIISAREKEGYFDVLEEADDGDLRGFARMLEWKATQALERARRSAEKVLGEARRYHHHNGDLSTKDENGWRRHKGHSGWESELVLTPEEERMRRGRGGRGEGVKGRSVLPGCGH